MIFGGKTPWENACAIRAVPIPSRSRGLATGLMLVLAAQGLAACSRSTPLPQADAPQFTTDGDKVIVPVGSPLRTNLVVGPVENADLSNDVVAPASVEADPARQTKVLTPLTGQVVRLGVQLGDHVRAGQALAYLSSPDLSSAISDDTHARAQLALTKAALERAQGLQKIGGGADKDLQQAQSDYAGAQAEALRAAERLHQVSASAKMHSAGGLVLTAPSSGTITDLGVSKGSFWTDPTAPLMTVTDISTVWVTANVAEQDIGSVRPGETVTISFSAFPNETVQGRVDSVGAILDPDMRRTKVRIALPNPQGRFKPGMFATVTFSPAAHLAPTVPDTALLLRNDQTVVYAEVQPWVFEPRVVDIGVEKNGHTVIQSGVAAGQRVIIKGGVLIDD